MFLVDSDAFRSGLQSVQETQPDADELMPALLPEFIEEYCSMLEIPIITGGLLRKREQMLEALGAGAAAVSVGSPALWKENVHDEPGSVV